MVRLNSSGELPKSRNTTLIALAVAAFVVVAARAHIGEARHLIEMPSPVHSIPVGFHPSNPDHKKVFVRTLPWEVWVPAAPRR